MAPESIAGCLEQLRGGGCVLIVDSAAEPPEAVLGCAAARVTPPTVNFLVTHGHVTPIQAAQGRTPGCRPPPEGGGGPVRPAGMGAEAVVCAVLGLSGNLASAAELDALATRHGLPRVSISEVIQMRLRSDTLVRRVAEAMLPLRDGPTFRAIVYDNSVDQHQHMAL